MTLRQFSKCLLTVLKIHDNIDDKLNDRYKFAFYGCFVLIIRLFRHSKYMPSCLPPAMLPGIPRHEFCALLPAKQL
jgi:hypothetical protein